MCSLCVSLRLCLTSLFLLLPLPPRSTLFPYTTLFRSLAALVAAAEIGPHAGAEARRLADVDDLSVPVLQEVDARHGKIIYVGDRKSTRLNSSHLGISYAVFCLKKKKTEQQSEHSRHHL